MVVHQPTLKDIALEAGVSKNTVSLALRHNSRISRATRERIEKIANDMGYRKNSTVSHLMAELSKSQRSSIKSCLAILNANPNPVALLKHPTLPTYVKGCVTRANELGYNVDHFWLHDKDLNGQKLSRILRARNIQGGVIVGLTRTRFLPEKFSEIWDNFQFVVTGVRTINPTLPFASTDHHNLAIEAIRKAAELGYKRPAMVLDREIDNVVDGRFSAGVRTAQLMFPELKAIKPFFFEKRDLDNKAGFKRWFEKSQPDVVLTLFNVVRHWMEDLSLKIPEDVGLIQLEWREDHPECAGMNQHNDVVGSVAVEMAINRIYYQKPGVPQFPLATLVGGTWVEGATVRQVAPRTEMHLDALRDLRLVA